MACKLQAKDIDKAKTVKLFDKYKQTADSLYFSEPLKFLAFSDSAIEIAKQLEPKNWALADLFLERAIFSSRQRNMPAYNSNLKAAIEQLQFYSPNEKLRLQLRINALITSNHIYFGKASTHQIKLPFSIDSMATAANAKNKSLLRAWDNYLRAKILSMQGPDSLLMAYKLLFPLKDSLSIMDSMPYLRGEFLYHFGIINYKLGKRDEGLRYIEKATLEHSKNNDTLGLVRIWANPQYNGENGYTNLLKAKKFALKNRFYALLSVLYINLGYSYHYSNVDNLCLENTQEYLNIMDSFPISTKDSFTRLILYTLSGKTQLKLNNKQKAIAHLKQAESFITSVTPYNNLKELFATLKQYYQEEGNFSSALQYANKIDESYSKYLVEERRLKFQKLINKLNTYENEIENNKISTQNKKLTESVKNKQKNIFILIISSTLLLSLLLLFYYWRQRNERQNRELEKKENELIADKNIRKKISQELHDRIGGSLSALHLKLSNNSGSASKTVDTSLVEEMSAISNSVRTLSHELYNTHHKKSSFCERIKDLIHLYGESVKNVVIKLRFHNDEKINGLSSTILSEAYPIIQELVKNAVIHSGAKNIETDVSCTATELLIHVNDNGHGFNPKNTSLNNGIGLKSIKDRVVQLKGTLKIDSKKETGTSILIIIPK